MTLQNKIAEYLNSYGGILCSKTINDTTFRCDIDTVTMAADICGICEEELKERCNK